MRRCCFPRPCRNIATCWSRARAVLLLLSAEAQGDEVRARIQSVEPLDQAAEKLQKSMQIFLRDPAPARP